MRAGLAAETRSAPADETLLRSALGRVRLARPAADPQARRRALAENLAKSLRDSQDAGILRETVPVEPLLENLVDDPAR